MSNHSTMTLAVTPSGDYVLPSRARQIVGNLVLAVAPHAPRAIGEWFVGRRAGFYQQTGTLSHDSQGLSENKWAALDMPADLRGTRVLDIGCSEGFFVMRCAERGARARGIDTNLGRLLTATFQARRDGLRTRFRMGVFPGPQSYGTYDYVLCLSVLHHSLRQKDVWKVLVEPGHADDLATLRGLLRRLRSLTALRGRCIIEMPYEYDDPDAERQVVDFSRFCTELTGAGFSGGRVLGSWDYNPDHMRFKDRIIYVAEA